MKRSTAIGRLGEVAESLDRLDWLDPKIVAGYVHGELLSDATTLDRVEIVLVVDAPCEVVPWMARPPHLEAIAWLLRFPKLPLSWCWRPAGWPVWNHRIVNPVRFWTIEDHVDTAVVDALTAGGTVQLAGERPADAGELVAQLETERQVGRVHLDRVLAGFYERDGAGSIEETRTGTGHHKTICGGRQLRCWNSTTPSASSPPGSTHCQIASSPKAVMSQLIPRCRQCLQWHAPGVLHFGVCKTTARAGMETASRFGGQGSPPGPGPVEPEGR